MPVVPFPQREGQARAPQVNPIFLTAAMADLHQAGMLVEPPGPPLDIRSPAQMGDMQKIAKTWPEGTDPSVKKIFDDRLKAGDITRDQYNKAMRDPRQFTGND